MIATLDGELVTTDTASREASKADVSSLAIEANVEGHVTDAQSIYDPPTRTEATSDKNEILAHGDTSWSTATGFSTHTPDEVWDIDLSSHTTTGTAGDTLSKLLRIGSGRWKIASNQMIFYDTDGTTELYKFNLLDSSGNPSETSVYESVRV